MIIVNKVTGMNKFDMLHPAKIELVAFDCSIFKYPALVAKAQLLYFLAHDKKIPIHRGIDDRFLYQLQNKIPKDLAT
jgi:hypothetical protein